MLTAMAAMWRIDGRSTRRHGRTSQPDSVDSIDSLDSIDSVPSYTTSAHFHPPSESPSNSSSSSLRIWIHSKFSTSGSSLMKTQSSSTSQSSQSSRCDCSDLSPTGEQEDNEERSQFSSRGTYSAERGIDNLKGASLSALRDPGEGTSSSRGTEPSITTQEVFIFGDREFSI